MSAAEEWRPVVGFEGLYEVSDLGRVRSLDRVLTYLRNGRAMQRFYRGQEVQPGPHRGGYLSIHLHRGGGKATAVSTTVHAVVAEAFLGPRPAGHQVCHFDGDKHNCRADNLRYDTPKANHQDKVRHGNFGPGEQATFVKLTEAAVVDIRRRRGEPQQRLADEYGCTFSNISAIQRGKSWAHVAA